MSRTIQHATFHLTEEEKKLRTTKNGKIIFTKYKDNLCGLYLCDNRLLAAQVISNSLNRINAIYIGKIKNIIKNINACFVEIDDGEICFLSMEDAKYPFLLNRNYDGKLLEGDELLVQICREEQKGKKASVTAHISLSDERIVLALGNPHIGFSGKLSQEKKAEIKNILTENNLQNQGNFCPPNNMKDTKLPQSGLIIRTAAQDSNCTDLLNSITALMTSMLSLIETAQHRTCFSCIKKADDDYQSILNQLAYPNEYHEIVTDDSQLYKQLNLYCKENMPDINIRLYEDQSLSLLNLYSIEKKLEVALGTRVWLKSGAYLVIEQTEALTVIDVNTGKYEGKKLSSETYQQINCEAAEEIAIQLRLRNISGIIIVDFINMKSKDDENHLLHFMQKLVRKDKIKTNALDITSLGLMQLTRQKINKPLSEQL